ncbi:MAG: prepilin-type N-terminal cleavage/methylation domain-containing protein [Candidatus Omnitrophica bacterium]|nr:prepilin-type N-terminal cleavage/methylation domain-containing protein [Candidatus Omnitrophota bacterium]
MDRKALSLLEIIISMVILALVIAGIVNVFVAAKSFIQRSRYRTTGGELGKIFLDPLQVYIRQDTWAGSNCFNTDNASTPANMADCSSVPSEYTVGSSTYTPQYYISNVDTDVKKVKLKITLPSVE